MILCVVDFKMLEQLHYALICTAAVWLNIFSWPDMRLCRSISCFLKKIDPKCQVIVNSISINTQVNFPRHLSV